MIEAIIFDLGDVFINLEIQKSQDAFKRLGLKTFDAELQNVNKEYEIGKITETAFLSAFAKQIPNATIDQIKNAWNLIIGDFPRYRLDFLKTLSQKYRLFLLSNTDATHIEHFKQKDGAHFYIEFQNCFEKIYYSFAVGMRKPGIEIFNHLLAEQNLQPKNTLFVDDKKENIESAKTVGIQTWHLQVGKEDVIDLFAVCASLIKT